MKKVDYHNFFLLYIKISETTYYKKKQRNTILNRAKDYSKINKEVWREKAKNKYRELSEEKKCKKKIWKE